MNPCVRGSPHLKLLAHVENRVNRQLIHRKAIRQARMQRGRAKFAGSYLELLSHSRLCRMGRLRTPPQALRPTHQAVVPSLRRQMRAATSALSVSTVTPAGEQSIVTRSGALPGSASVVAGRRLWTWAIRFSTRPLQPTLSAILSLRGSLRDLFPQAPTMR